MESLENALNLLLGRARREAEMDRLPLLDALGRVTAEDLVSPMAVPPFDRSPLDGYAIRCADIAGASKEHPAVLTVIGEAFAGCGESFEVLPGQALRIMTGAPVPPSCDGVIRQEDTDLGMDTVQIYAPVRSGRNICRRGEDVAEGTLLVKAGEVLTAAHLGVLASVGVAQVKVMRRVRVALLCTGDELTQPGENLSFGKIYDSSRTLLTARLRELGAEVLTVDSVPDEPEKVASLLSDAAREADLLITTGGVSVGKKDIMHRVLPIMGAERLFWQVAMKPGSPLLAGAYDGKLLICLSGNPFAAMACFELFAKPVLLQLAGCADVLPRRITVPMADDFDKASPGRRLIRAKVDERGVTLGQVNHSSGALSGVIGCNALVDIPAGSPALKAGDRVEAVLL